MGEPWPLAAAPIVGSSSYIVSAPEALPGLITIETTSKFVPAGLVIAIQGRQKPLTFQLNSDGSILDAMVNITIEGKSPLNTIAATRPYSGLSVPNHDQNNIAQFLDQAPADAQKMVTIGDSRITVWRWGDYSVIRTPYTLLDPSTVTDVQSRADSIERIYLLPGRFNTAAFLNENTSDVVNIEIVGG